MQNEGYSLQDVTALIRRRAKLVARTFLTITLLSVVIAYSTESLYRSTGRIVIERPEVSERFLPGTYQSTNRELRIARINDEVMTRRNLAEIVEKHNLYSDLRGDDPASLVVPELRRNFGLEVLLSEDDPRQRDRAQVLGFELSFFHPDPITAQKVAQDIVEMFMRGNRQRRQLAYEETAAALTRETENLRVQVSQLEGQLADFKTEHPGALPEDRTYNRQIMERKARDLDGLDREIRSLQDRKTLLQSQLAQTDLWITAVGPDGDPLPASADRLQLLQDEYLRLLGNYSSTHPDVQRVRREIESLTSGAASPALRQALMAELAKKQSELFDARTRYGEEHPDVRLLQRSIAALEQQLAQMPADSKDLPPPNNPTYINLQLQLQGVNNELVALRLNQKQLQREISELDATLQIAPEVERRYLEITRDLSVARQQYEETIFRQMAIQRAGALEEEELADRYVITDIPSLPFTPAYPNRPLYIVIGIFLGLTFAVGFGLAAESLDGTVRSTRDIRTILEMPPIAAVPSIHTTADLRQMRLNRIVSLSTIIAIIAIVAVYVQLQITSTI